ncbi:MAG: YihA family ribosome biogenesis GTP-binding protein [Acidobacteria bacterium]|nr:YihA family ribosome biogenesis GTP-binding protein [Acidobacteriota bacterium]
MKITSVEYLLSARSATDYPRQSRPEIAFAGRSNVGKSSLINTLLKRRGIAKTSSTPGKTRCINFFLINGSFYFVDLPGYGYAKVSRHEQQQWGGMIEEYLQAGDRRKLVVMLVDCRHAASPLDLQMKQWLDHHSLAHVIVATKADKLSKNQLAQSLRRLGNAFDGSVLLPFSAENETGRLELWRRIQHFIDSDEQPTGGSYA